MRRIAAATALGTAALQPARMVCAQTSRVDAVSELLLRQHSRALVCQAWISAFMAAGILIVGLTALIGGLILVARVLQCNERNRVAAADPRMPRRGEPAFPGIAGAREALPDPAFIAAPMPRGSMPPPPPETHDAGPGQYVARSAPGPGEPAPATQTPVPPAADMIGADDREPQPLSATAAAERLEEIAAALETEPNRPDLWFRRGQYHRRLGHIAQALDAYARATILAPNRADYWMARAEAFAEANQREASERCVDQALAADPDHPVALVGRGRCLAADRRYAEALDAFEAALHIRPQDPIILTNSGLCLTHLGRYEEAGRYYDRAIALSPRYAPAYQGKAHCLMKLNRDDEAIACYNRALHLRQENAPPSA